MGEKRGLFNKYEIKRTDGGSDEGGKHERCEFFVLDIDHDPHAKAALAAYAASCEAERPELAADLRRHGWAVEAAYMPALRAIVDHARAVLEESRADESPFTRWALQSAIDEYDRIFKNRHQSTCALGTQR